MRKKAKKTRPRQKRVRGGASHPCPSCGSTTHVIVTRRHGETVVRRRQCRRHEAHRFTTEERAS
jgi:predicted RNA-binding Zn-ribbon protein involved in translation (DUF1610 family)